VRSLRTLGLCLLATLAIGAIAAASASAGPPELGRCVKVAKGAVGKYKDPGCEKGEVPKGIYEWIPGVIKPKFTSSEGKSTFETVGKFKLTCTSDTDSGEYLPPKGDTETIVFKGCKLTGMIGKEKISLPCSNGAPEEITTAKLNSVLGFIKAPTEVGVSLENPTGGPFAEFERGGVRVSITGSVIAKVTPISRMTITFKEMFVATKGLQKPEAFEKEPKDTLSCNFLGKSEQCGFTSADTVTNEELIEINEVL